MKITIWTMSSDNLMREARKLLRQRGQSEEQVNALRYAQSDAQSMTFEELSEAQFCAYNSNMMGARKRSEKSLLVHKVTTGMDVNVYRRMEICFDLACTNEKDFRV